MKKALFAVLCLMLSSIMLFTSCSPITKTSFDVNYIIKNDSDAGELSAYFADMLSSYENVGVGYTSSNIVPVDADAVFQLLSAEDAAMAGVDVSDLSAADGYFIRIKGKDVLVVAATEDGYKNATDYFAKNILSSEGRIIVGEYYMHTYGETTGDEQHTINGVPLSFYSIVIPYMTTDSVKYAAEELSSYLARITGITLPIITDNNYAEGGHEITLGQTNRGNYTTAEVDTLGDEGYIIRTTDKRLEIIGSDVRGTLYGVYTLLDDYCGCGFYSNSYETVPEAASLALESINVTDIPKFEFSDSYWNAQVDADISARLKVNSQHGRIEDGEGLVSKHGGGITFTGGFCHTLGDLSGEYYPCLTDSEIYSTVLGNVLKKLRRNPDATIFSVSQNDGSIVECTCKNCLAVFNEEKAHSGTLVRFINKLQVDVAKEFPNVQIDTLAYRYSRKPPEKTKVDDRVIIRLCSIEACNRHAWNDCGVSPAHTVYDNLYESLLGWSEICNNLYIWDYNTNFTDFQTAYPNWEVLQKNIKLYSDCGVKGVFSQGNIASPNGEFGALKAFVTSKLLWNPDMTTDEYWALVDEGLSAFYGEGASYLREYINYTLDCSYDSHFNIYFDDISQYMYDRSVSDKEDGKFLFLENSYKLFADAKAATADDDRTFNNIRMAEIQLLDYEFFIQFNKKSKMPNGMERQAIEARCIEINKDHFSRLRQYSITKSREFHGLSTVIEPDYTIHPLLWGVYATE